MSDTTNVMKGARSGVQKLIKNDCSRVDVGYLAVIAGMQALPFQLFVDIFYHRSKRKKAIMVSDFIDEVNGFLNCYGGHQWQGRSTDKNSNG